MLGIDDNETVTVITGEYAKRIKEELNKARKDSCINCRHFAWWDGDYCCTCNMMLLVESATGKVTKKDLDYLKKVAKDCNDFDYRPKSPYRELAQPGQSSTLIR